RIAGEPQRDVRLQRRRRVGRGAVEVAPRAVVALLRADPVAGEARHVGVGDAEELAQEQVLRLHRHVRLQFALPPAGLVLQREQARDRPPERLHRRGAARLRRRRHAAPRVRSRCAPSSAACAAAAPLRTALSIVAGQPVAVQAPARKRPGTFVAAAGRCRAVPGTPRNVARGSRVTKKERTSADRAAGSRSASAARNSSRSSSEVRSPYASAPESEIARYWPSATPALAVR